MRSIRYLAPLLMLGVAGPAIFALSQRNKEMHLMTTNTSQIVSDINAFVAVQNESRGQTLASGGILPLDYNSLTGTVPAGANAVTGISGIAANAANIALPTSQAGNAVIIDGAVSSTASTTGTDSYSFVVDTSGTVTMTDNNTGNSQTITGASYLLFDGAATTSSGAYQSLYMVETGNNAEIASMYNAAFERVPDLAGLEFYIDQLGSSLMPDLHKIAVFFEGSPEFKTLYPALSASSDNGGPNDQAFISQLYGGILHRTPTASEVNFYVEALQGTLTNSSGQTIAAADRATLLEYFTASPENQSDISAANGGWLINPGNGASSFGSPNTQAALTAEAATGTINTATIGTVSSSTNINITTPAGSTGVIGAGAPLTSGGTELLTFIDTTVSGETIYLSSNVNAAFLSGPNQNIYGASSGQSQIFLPSVSANEGGTIHLSGTGNILIGSNIKNITVPTQVYGFTDGDTLAPFLQITPAPAGTIITGTASAPINGASLQSFGRVAYAVDLGNVGDGSAATVASAAAAVYQVGHIAGEGVSFYGTTNAGNTVIYNWFGQYNTASTVTTAGFTSAVELIGVIDTQVHANWFG